MVSHRRSGSPAPSCLSPLDDGTPFLILGDPLPLLPSNIAWGPNRGLELYLLGTMLSSIPSSSIRMQTAEVLLSCQIYIPVPPALSVVFPIFLYSRCMLCPFL